jgi:CheY-like chemotaxis protein
MEISLSPTNINEQIEDIYSFFKKEADQKGIKFSYKKTLSSNESIIKTDKEKLNSILTNLIKNAIKFTDNGSVEFGYYIVSKQLAGSIQHAASLQFYVIDTGIGIPHDRHAAIFDRFVQADIEDKRAFQGAGLGLSISKAYAEMLGGTIWLKSEEGKGSSFYFSVPYLPVVLDDDALEINNSDTSQDNEVKKLKILIAEDDHVSELVITRIVKSISRETINVRSGDEAVAACLKNPDIDLVLMDIKMPGIDGYESTRQIRQFNMNVVIIAQTAFALVGDYEKALEAGCNDYISKPLKKELLLEKIKKQFENSNDTALYLKF